MLMFQWFVDCVYNCCFGFKQKHKNNKLREAIYAIEDLTQEQYNKLMWIYNIKCC